MTVTALNSFVQRPCLLQGIGTYLAHKAENDLMKTKYFFSALFTLLMVSGAFAQSLATGIQFQPGTWQEMLAKSKSSGKIIFVDAYAVWCGPCKMLAANTFTDASVGEFFNANFVNYKFDMEKGEGPAFAKQYQVSAYPTMFFIKPDGTVAKKQVGYIDAKTLLGIAQMVVTSNPVNTKTNN